MDIIGSLNQKKQSIKNYKNNYPIIVASFEINKEVSMNKFINTLSVFFEINKISTIK